MIDFFIASYLLIDYLMHEKERMEEMKDLLKKGGLSEKDRKIVEGLVEWHRQNYMQFLKRPPEWIPWCVKQYLLGYRGRPGPKEIQEEYARRREHFKEKEKIRIKIAWAFAVVAALYVLLSFKFGN